MPLLQGGDCQGGDSLQALRFKNSDTEKTEEKTVLAKQFYARFLLRCCFDDSNDLSLQLLVLVKKIPCFQFIEQGIFLI